MAEMIGGMLCLEEDEAAALAGFLRHNAPKMEARMRETLSLLADQLQTKVNVDPFMARRFSISVEQRRIRQ